MAVIHVAAGLSGLRHKEKVTGGVQLLDERFVHIPVKGAVPECRQGYTCRELTDPGDALVNLGTAQKPQNRTQAADAALGGVGLILVEGGTSSAACLADYHAYTAFACAGRFLGNLLYIRNFWGVEDRQFGRLGCQCVTYAL